MGSFQEAVLRLYWAGQDFPHLSNEKHKVNICKLLIFVYGYFRSYFVNRRGLLNTKCMKSGLMCIISDKKLTIMATYGVNEKQTI